MTDVIHMLCKGLDAMYRIGPDKIRSDGKPMSVLNEDFVCNCHLNMVFYVHP